LMRLDLKEVGNKNMSRSLFSTYVSKWESESES
jgi:hypothetical protein